MTILKSKSLDIWKSDQDYLICQNINDGTPPEKWKGEVDRYGHRWLFEITKIEKGEECHIGTAPTLRSAKEVARCDAEGM